MVLQVISEEPSYGYAIVKKLKERTGEFFQAGEGTLYPHLYTLENKGFIKGDWVKVESGRKRKYYKLTSKGRKQLKDKKAEWGELVKMMKLVLGEGKHVCGA